MGAKRMLSVKTALLAVVMVFGLYVGGGLAQGHALGVSPFDYGIKWYSWQSHQSNIWLTFDYTFNQRVKAERKFVSGSTDQAFVWDMEFSGATHWPANSVWYGPVQIYSNTSNHMRYWGFHCVLVSGYTLRSPVWIQTAWPENEDININTYIYGGGDCFQPADTSSSEYYVFDV